MLDIEIWKDIPQYEGYYQISSLGRVKSMKRESARGFMLKEKILKGSYTTDRYMQLRLWRDAEKQTWRIHRLVAIAFIPNPDGKPQVNHKDNNRSNNALNNLEWATQLEDMQHKAKQNRQNRPIGDKNPMYGKKGSLHPVYGKRGKDSYNFGGKSGRARIVLDTESGIFYDCIKDAADAKTVNQFTLNNKLLGNRKNNTSLIYA